jgi:hypothetical protein
MSDNSFVLNMLGESRKRLVGSLMGYLEKEVYPKLSQPERDDLRMKVLTSVGAYNDTCRDMIKASVGIEDGITNELAIQAIYDIHDEVKELRRDFEDVYEM